MIPAIQVYVPEPKLGELLAMAYDREFVPVVFAGYNKEGGWQVLQLNSWRGHKKGISQHHDKRLIRLDINVLSREDRSSYEITLKKLTK